MGSSNSTDNQTVRLSFTFDMQSKKGESVTKDKKLSVIMEESPRQVAEESLADMEEDPITHTEKIVTKIKKSRAAKMYKTATGLEFDCYLMGKNDKKKIKPESTIYMVAVLEYLLAEVLEVSGDCTKALKKKVIKPRHIKLAVTNDGELKHLFSAVQIPGGGVVPGIPAVLRKTVDSNTFKGWSKKNLSLPNSGS